MSPPAAIHTIGVIVGRDLIGDALIKLPFLRALRAAWPRAEIDWITSQGPTAYSGPLRQSTQHLIDTIYEQPGWINGAGNTPHFDLLIDTRNRWREAEWVKSHLPHGLFLAPALRYLLSDRRPKLVELINRPPHLVDRLLQLVALAAGYRPAATGALPIPEAALAKARQSLPAGSTYIGLAPGAGNPVKAWPRYKFEKVALAQIARGRVPVFLLGPQELDWYGELSATIPDARFPLQDNAIWGDALTLEQTLALGSVLTLAVANDSGTGHMLAAVDCPLISLFGPTSAAKLAPRVSHGLIIKAQDYGSDQMNAIHWETVCDAIENFVSTSNLVRN